MNAARRQFGRRNPAVARRGSILYIVLVIIALLTLAAYQYSEIMVTERTASNLYGRRVQVRAFADSGIEAAAMMLGQQQNVEEGQQPGTVNLYHNPPVFGALLMQGTNGGAPASRGRYAVVSPVEADATAKSIRFGLADECGKLNLNTFLSVIGKDEDAALRARDVLLQLPGMTTEMADAILDWLDADDDVREYGAEIETYDRYGYEPANGPLESIDELLLIRPDLITPQLVFGFDVNRNGVLDGAEVAAAAENPGIHPLGWNAFLTVYSKESNLKANGDPKIDLNNGDLAALYDEIVENFDGNNAEDLAKFVVAYRMYGPKDAQNSPPASQGVAGSSTGKASQGGQQGGLQLNQQATKQAAQAVGQALFKSGSQEKVTRGGLDLSGGGKFSINSIYDLVDVEVSVSQGTTTSTLASPWTTSNIANELPAVLDQMSTTNKKFINGRININQAREEVLKGIIASVPGFDEDPDLAAQLTKTIVDNKMIDPGGAPLTDTIESRKTTAWLLTEGNVTIEQMRQLDRYLTTRGDVYRAQVVGFFDQGGPVARVEVLIDATQRPPRVIFQRDLTNLGRGFTPKQLGVKVQ